LFFNALIDSCLITFLIHTTSVGLYEVIKQAGRLTTAPLRVRIDRRAGGDAGTYALFAPASPLRPIGSEVLPVRTAVLTILL
jgi:hypothetical protein